MKRRLRKQCLDVMRSTFGVDAFRPGQEAAVNALLTGRDLLCVLPTGAGKSLCYELPAVLHNGMTLVVSPLIALMRDQVAHLAARGIAAVCLDSLQSKSALAESMEAIRRGNARIVYVSPERLEVPAFREACRAVPPWLVVVDEAHCVVRWGAEFRPAYLNIADFITMLPARPVVCAMTATADPSLKRALCRALQLAHVKRITLPMVRPNLIYRVLPTLNRDHALMTLVNAHPDGRIVVFCGRRTQTERLCRLLTGAGHQAAYYHAGMERTERIRIQEAFTHGRLRIVTATTAFGMGIDVPDIRLVVQYDLPDDLTDYAQQSGRAGRDGQAADCVLLFDPASLVYLGRRIRRLRHERPDVDRWTWLRKYLHTLRAKRQLLDWCLNGRCLSAGLAHAFGQRATPCHRCANCVRSASSGQMRRIAHSPAITRMDEAAVAVWTLEWLRDGIARQRQIRPSKLLSYKALTLAARKTCLTCDDIADTELRIRAQAALTHLHGTLRSADGSTL